MDLQIYNEVLVGDLSYEVYNVYRLQKVWNVWLVSLKKHWETKHRRVSKRLCISFQTKKCTQKIKMQAYCLIEQKPKISNKEVSKRLDAESIFSTVGKYCKKGNSHQYRKINNHNKKPIFFEWPLRISIKITSTLIMISYCYNSIVHRHEGHSTLKTDE